MLPPMFGSIITFRRMSRLLRLCRSSLGKKYIMAMTGLLLGLFLLAHAAGNSLLLQSREAFTAYAEHLREYRLLLPLAGLLLAAVFLLHALTGLSLFVSNRRAKGGRNTVSAAAGGQTLTSRAMPWTGTAVLAFLLVHLATVRFADPDLPTAERLGRALTEPLPALLHVVGVAALTLHISHGFWSLTQTFGLNHPRWNGLVKGCAWLAVIVIAGVFGSIILLYALRL